MNGATHPDIQQLNLQNPIVGLLEQLLAGAQAGQITSIGVVAIAGGGGYASLFVGQQMGDLYIGTGSLKKKIMDAVENPQKKSPILRAGMM